MTQHPTPENSAGSSGSERSSVRPQAIADRAYQKYLNSGQKPGCDVENWLQAEQELLAEQALQNPARVDDGEPIKVLSKGELAGCVSLQ